MQVLFCPCCGTGLLLLRSRVGRFTCEGCLAQLRADYRSRLIRNLQLAGGALVLTIYMYLLYEALWGSAFLLVVGWGSLFRAIVASFSPVLEVIVVSRPLGAPFRKMATAQGVMVEDFGKTIHPLGLF